MASREITYLCHLFAMRIFNGPVTTEKGPWNPSVFSDGRRERNLVLQIIQLSYLNSRKSTSRYTIMQTFLIFSPPMGKVEFSYYGGSGIIEVEMWILIFLGLRQLCVIWSCRLELRLSKLKSSVFKFWTSLAIHRFNSSNGLLAFRR